jgi:hypothetical protein
MRLPILLCFLAVSAPVRGQTGEHGPVLGAIAVPSDAAIKGWVLGGRIRLVGWDRDSIVVRGTLARGNHLVLHRDGPAAKIVVEDRENQGQNVGHSDLVAFIPRRSILSFKSVSADIIGQDVSGWFYSVSGNIRMSGTSSSMDAESMTGSLDFDVSVPKIHAHGGDGHMVVRGAPQDVDVTTVGGTISIGTPTILRGQFSTVSGNIQYASALSPSGIFDLSTHSGEIDLAIPAATSASLTLSDIHGRIENGFARARPAATSHAVKVTLGHGDAQVAARTFRGTIRVRPQ